MDVILFTLGLLFVFAVLAIVLCIDAQDKE